MVKTKLYAHVPKIFSIQKLHTHDSISIRTSHNDRISYLLAIV